LNSVKETTNTFFGTPILKEKEIGFTFFKIKTMDMFLVKDSMGKSYIVGAHSRKQAKNLFIGRKVVFLSRIQCSKYYNRTDEAEIIKEIQ
jgi:hypothetical protein